jgi:GDP-mannose mannosyl hydrolase
MVVPRKIADDEFLCVVRCAPLPSLDLIVRDSDRRVLVGLRTNEPAKNFGGWRP